MIFMLLCFVILQIRELLYKKNQHVQVLQGETLRGFRWRLPPVKGCD